MDNISAELRVILLSMIVSAQTCINILNGMQVPNLEYFAASMAGYSIALAHYFELGDPVSPTALIQASLLVTQELNSQKEVQWSSYLNSVEPAAQELYKKIMVQLGEVVLDDVWLEWGNDEASN